MRPEITWESSRQYQPPGVSPRASDPRTAHRANAWRLMDRNISRRALAHGPQNPERPTALRTRPFFHFRVCRVLSRPLEYGPARQELLFESVRFRGHERCGSSLVNTSVAVV